VVRGAGGRRVDQDPGSRPAAAAALRDRSLKPNGCQLLGTTLEQWAQGVLALVRNEPLVVGCSVGGSCALEVARAAPDQVRGIVLVGAKAGVRPDPAFRDKTIRLLTDHGIEAAWRALLATTVRP
jgi:pimeloyl-ACP methyl ester carboxylesterase